MLNTAEPVLDNHPSGQGKVGRKEGASYLIDYLCNKFVRGQGLVAGNERLVAQDTGHPRKVPIL